MMCKTRIPEGRIAGLLQGRSSLGDWSIIVMNCSGKVKGGLDVNIFILVDWYCGGL